MRVKNRKGENQQFLKVATVAMQCDISPEKNIERIERFIKRIKKEYPKVELIVFGETILGWYFNPGKTKEYHEEIAETIPGESTKRLSEIAKAENVYITFGMSEREGRSVFNSQVMINANGGIDAVHRKFFMRDSTFQAGNNPVTITDIKGLKIAFVICFDIRSIEVRKALKKSKKDIIIHSMADDEDPKFFGAGFLSRSFGTWYMTANRYGFEEEKFWNGHMFIANPLGKLLVKGFDEEQYLYYELKVNTKESRFKKFNRNIFLQFSLVIHILKHFRIASSFVKDASNVRRKKRHNLREKKKNN
ncbi:MAG: carbon-nitrogen hydrolase family protein [Candidatus Heimdallarchaeota archaeon]|nr:carbon-nitrogen hydrolase family protein [Candidatus Heimdallarchaeota archaeon]MBY8994227.1 carbon-nitrogen hydrolase family protein [Candidatus Heimdallarchaeota archaeon]